MKVTDARKGWGPRTVVGILMARQHQVVRVLKETREGTGRESNWFYRINNRRFLFHEQPVDAAMAILCLSNSVSF